MIRHLLLLLALTPALHPGAEPGAAQAPMPRAAGPVTFAAVVAAAAADAAALPPGLAAATRYLDARHLPAADRRELRAVLNYHVNGLSRESKRTPVREVTPWLWAVCLDDYRWSSETWEKLGEKNVYYAARAKIQVPGAAVARTRQVLRNGYYVTESYEEPGPAVEKDDVIVAPWLPPAEAAALVGLTGSKTPIVRGDQFLNLTLAQTDRTGHGYYDWLGLGGKLADAEALATLDRRKAIDAYREVAGVVNVSGVALANRQLFRFATVAGAWWESRDAKENTGAKNALSNLLDDFKADAFEVVFTLPNGLPGYFLANDKGERQDTAPDFIAADHRAANNDRRVHVGYSCVACHTDGGLRPIRDYMRRVYTPETGLSLGALAADPAQARRLESAYLGPLQRWYDRDRGDYAEAIEDASGLKAADLSKAVERQWSRYLDEPVTLDRAAAEAGVTPDRLRDGLRRHARTRGIADPVLAVYLTDDPPPVRREHFEERFSLLMLTLAGAAP